MQCSLSFITSNSLTEFQKYVFKVDVPIGSNEKLREHGPQNYFFLLNFIEDHIFIQAFEFVLILTLPNRIF